MVKICFIGAGSTIFAKSVIGDCILTPEIGDFEVALFDIDPVRLEDSRRMLEHINKKYNGKATIKAFLNRREALASSDFIVNAIQVGGYKPATVTDFEIPKKYNLRHTVNDTLNVGGIFRALRTIPLLDSIAEDIHAVAPNALFLNYTNPMAMLMGYTLRYLDLNAVGLCHSVQSCAPWVLKCTGLEHLIPTFRWKIAGINHQAWLYDIRDEKGNDIYPEVRRRAKEMKHTQKIHDDGVRFDIMEKFGYYNTESSEHTAEYHPYYIKSNYPELISRFKIPLDLYVQRCEEQIAGWAAMREKLTGEGVEHQPTEEFASYIIKAAVTDQPFRLHGNVLNTGLITNLPNGACVEVPCMADRNGINPCYVGDLPEQCAALNRTNINVQNMAILAAKERKREYVYMAASLDPHTASELSLDDIRLMVDDMFEAHGNLIPKYK